MVIAAATSRPQAGATSVPDWLAQVAAALSGLPKECTFTTAQLGEVLEAAGFNCMVSPPPPGSDAIDRLRCELARLRIGGRPAYPLPHIRRQIVREALQLLNGVDSYREILAKPGTSKSALSLAQDLFCMRSAQADLDGES